MLFSMLHDVDVDDTCANCMDVNVLFVKIKKSHRNNMLLAFVTTYLWLFMCSICCYELMQIYIKYRGKVNSGGMGREDGRRSKKA